MKSSPSAMFQGALILVAISAAFAQVNPTPTPCQIITDELRSGFLPDDPHTFPNISDFIYIRDNVRIIFDFFNLTLKGFSNVYCNSFNASGQPLATLDLEGYNLELNTNDADMYINIRPLADIDINPLKTNFSSQLRFYTLDLRFKIDSYIPDPFSLCITRDSLEMTFHAEGIESNVGVSPDVTRELNDHPKEVVEAINRYLPRLANNFTTALNNILC
ncbi:uncharacterized protein [Palaemon carinicauda]|uniref:uncharacterized protein isoform X1 n=1 Tax=Palaemon carinicauda TaxID=392227 RepID=UPI0035B5A5F5